MEENNLDKYFKEKLEGYTEEPSPAVWDGIDSKLPKGGFVWNKRYLILLLLLISIGGAAFLGYRLYEVDSRVAELENKIKTEKSQTTSKTEENSGEGSDQKAQKASANKKSGAVRIPVSEDQALAQIPRNSNKENDFNESRDGENPPIEASETNHSKNSGGSSSNTNQALNAGLALTPKPSKESSTPESESASELNPTAPIGTSPSVRAQTESSTPREPMASSRSSSMAFSPTLLSSITPSAMLSPEFNSRERDVDYFREPGRDWYLFVYGMANYTHRRVVSQAVGAEAIPNRLDKAENGLITPGAGLRLSRELGNSFRLSVGVEYNQWIQEGNYSTVIRAEQVELVTNEASQMSEFNLNGSLEGSLGATAFSASSTENPFSNFFELLSPSSELEVRINTTRRISYLSIPVTLEYVYRAYPFTFTMGAGISVNPIIGSDFEYSLNEAAPDLGLTPANDLSGTYFSFQAGLGIEYGFSERMSLRLNPSYRGWMTPIFENEEIRTLPFGVAIRAGIIYRLGKQ